MIKRHDTIQPHGPYRIPRKPIGSLGLLGAPRVLIRPFKGLIRPLKGPYKAPKGPIMPQKSLVRPILGLIRPLRPLQGPYGRYKALKRLSLIRPIWAL